MVIKFLSIVLFVVSLNINAKAQSSNPLFTIQKIESGLMSGLYNNLKQDHKLHFVQLLEQAQNVLFSSGSTFACVSDGNGAYIVKDLDTNKSYGSVIYGLQNCKDTLPVSGSSFACLSGGNGGYTLTNLDSGITFGQLIYGLDNCKESLPVAGQKFACVSNGNGAFVITNLQTGTTIGSAVYGMANCKAQLP
jgi:hypothetical protein